MRWLVQPAVGVPQSRNQGVMPSLLQRATYYLALSSAVCILFSIALSQILLALSLATLLLSGEKLDFPPIRLPLVLFFAITVAALAASGDVHNGTPQLRKFFIFGIVLVIYSSFRSVRQVEALVVCWAGVGLISASMGLVQFLYRRQQAFQQNADNYGFYVDGRITGFASHWMTFGGEEMIVLLMLASFLLFSISRRWMRCLWPVAITLWAAIVLGMTRSIFLLGLPVGILYLVWRLRPLMLLALPVVAAVGMVLAPASVRERIYSVTEPHAGIDSNAHRAVCRIVGWEMIKAHPWLGLGPEQIGRQFDRYVPQNESRPLPKGWYGHLHNIYLQYAAERGVFGLLTIMWLVAKAAFDFLKVLRRKCLAPETRAILHGAVAVILAVLAAGAFEYNLGDSEVLTLFLSVIACGYVAIRHAPAEPEPDQASTSDPAELMCGLRSINA